jgi:hypothetical protein
LGEGFIFLDSSPMRNTVDISLHLWAFARAASVLAASLCRGIAIIGGYAQLSFTSVGRW